MRFSRSGAPSSYPRSSVTFDLNYHSVIIFRAPIRISQCHLAGTRLREPGQTCGRERFGRNEIVRYEKLRKLVLD